MSNLHLEDSDRETVADHADHLEGVPSVQDEILDELEYERSLWGVSDLDAWENEQVFQDGVLESYDY